MEFDAVSDLADDIARSFRTMSGDRQDVKPTLGFSATDATKLHRQIKLLIDSGERGVSEASLGSANLIFLTLKTMELHSLIVATSGIIHFSQLRSPKHISRRAPLIVSDRLDRIEEDEVRLSRLG